MVEEIWKAARLQLGGSDDRIYETCSAYALVHDLLLGKPVQDAGQTAAAVDKLSADGNLHLAISDLTDSLADKHAQIQACVHGHITSWRSTQDIHTIQIMISALAQHQQQWISPLLSINQPGEAATLQNRLQQMAFNSMPPDFGPALYSYLTSLLDAGLDDTKTDFDNLRACGFLERYRPILISVIHDKVSRKIKSDCAGRWVASELAAVLYWVSDQVIPLLHTILLPAASIEAFHQRQKSTIVRLEHHVHKVFSQLRISELFDIIVEFPDSTEALIDLRTCIERTDDRALLTQKLREANVKRLLHPGADTKDIIDQYVSTIRCLRILDASGMLLSRVAEPIRTYLRARDDTIRCVMSALVEEGSELVSELEKGGEKEIISKKKEAEDYTDPNWEPDPIDAPANFWLSRRGDVIQMLVSIYDSKDVFMQEFQNLLAQSLLSVKDYDVSRQIRNVEILKKRFGESSLASCEVMLKDLADSKRIDQNIHGLTERNPIHPIVVSHLFWPTLQSSNLVLPEHFSALHQSYQQSFTTFKPDKYLKWLPHLGSVELEIELDDRVLSLEVTPVQAAVAEAFRQQPIWHLNDLAAKLTSPPDVHMIKNAVYFWANHNMLREDPDTRHWCLAEIVQGTVAQQHAILEDEPVVAEAPPADEMRMHWQYIRSMLANLGSLPLDRIHTMLARTVPAYKGRTSEDLAAFLDLAAQEGAVACENGFWKLL